jgi:hypothetical protein
MMDRAVETVVVACDAAADGDLGRARDAIGRLDLDGLVAMRRQRFAAVPPGLLRIRAPRTDPSRSQIDAMFSTDSYACRYTVCGQSLTIDARVLRELQRTSGMWLAKRPRLGWHPITWMHQTVHDQLVPGEPCCVTACWGCNSPKSNIPYWALAEAAGWELADRPTPNGWRGLTEFLPALRSLPTAIP